jgi:hypothetical protein
MHRDHFVRSFCSACEACDVLLAIDMRRSCVLIALAIAACSDEDPNYGAPSSIKGKDVPGVPVTEFFTGPYNATENALGVSPTDVHASRQLVALTPDLACFSCHGGQPTMPGNPAAFAGFVRLNGTNQPAANADVVVVSGGQRLATKSGKDGFFWISAAAGKLGSDARVAVRDSQGRISEMKQQLPNGGCTASSCHGPTEITGVAVVPE